jgi:precorrin-6A/cobalt-precorrin-6A reductase
VTRVLVLGGTAEARELAAALQDAGLQPVTSLAGRTAAPRLPPGEVRSGGFGGPAGLTGHLREQRYAAVVDATHPFAARITASAAVACAATGTPLVVLRRPGSVEQPGDRWTWVPDLAAAAADVAAREPTTVLLTLGRGGLVALLDALPRHPHRLLARSVERPEGPLPPGLTVVLGRGPFTADDERALLTGQGVGLLVTRDSGGSPAKLAVARELGLPVVVVERPPLPAGVVAVTAVDDALRDACAAAGRCP